MEDAQDEITRQSIHAEIPEISMLDKVSAGARFAQRAELSKNAPSNPYTLRDFLTHFSLSRQRPEAET